MLLEINHDFYCSMVFIESEGKCALFITGSDCNECKNSLNQRCKNYHRKFPTPEQFLEEYGVDYPNDGAVWYCWDFFDPKEDWWLDTYDEAKHHQQDKRFTNFAIVCICTPWGKPPADWRPA